MYVADGDGDEGVVVNKVGSPIDWIDWIEQMNAMMELGRCIDNMLQ